MWLKLERAFSVRSSPAQKYSSPACTKSVRLQLHKYSSPAQNAFVASNKPVRRECDSYLEVSSRDVASDERVRLQCELMFGGE